jgi:rubrerythrin
MRKMLAKFPTDAEGLTDKSLDLELLRLGMIAELDAINLYEQLAAAATDRSVKATLKDIAREEKTHFGEFKTLLMERDKEQALELEAASKEVAEKS